MEGFGGLKVGTDVQRVVLALAVQCGLAFFKCGMEEGITVGGKDYLVWLEVERDGTNMLSGDREPIDHTIGDVLVTHGLNHAGNDDGTGYVVAAEVVGGMPLMQQALHLVGAHGSQFGFVRFGIVEVGCVMAEG